MNRLFSIVFSGLFLIPLFQAVAGEDADAVTFKDKNIYAIHGDKLELLTDNLAFPEKVMVSTNGTFKVGKGNDRPLQDGQVLRRDGWLVSADGSVQPVVDHVGIREGRAYIVRDGQASQLTSTMNFPNGMTINPDCSGGNLPGGRTRALDGQLFRLDGTSIQAKDTVTLKNGRMVVQKDGTLITLGSVQIMGMSDGTRVNGNGSIQKQDGTVIQLGEGQTVLIEGAYYGR